MPSRTMFLVFLLAGAFLPYLLSSQSGLREAITTPLKMVSGDEQKPAAPAIAAGEPGRNPQPAAAAGAKTPAILASQSAVPKSTERFVDLEQALHWGITPAWILGTWPRVTTHLAELDMQGYRVTLVTGTNQTDLAGALTYYFDPKQQLQKIVFHGTTGDAKRLVQFLMTRHRFERRLLDDPSVYLYQVEQDGQALSEVRIKTASIVRTTSAFSRFEVALTMNRPEE